MNYNWQLLLQDKNIPAIYTPVFLSKIFSSGICNSES